MSYTLIEISDDLHLALKEASEIKKITIEEQLEIWARLGLLAEQALSQEEIKQLLQAERR